MPENGIDKPFYVDLVTFKCYNKYMKNKTKKGHSLMLSQKDRQSQNNCSRINSFFDKFKLGSIAKSCGFIKRNGIDVIYQLYMLIMYQFGISKNVYALFNSRHANDIDSSRSAIYEFMSKPGLNWEKMHLKLALKLISEIKKINGTSVPGYLVVDDTTLMRMRSKCVELLARSYDHVSGKFYKGFTELNIGWTDGISFIPLLIGILSAKKDESVLHTVATKLRKNSLAAKRRELARMSKLDVLIKFVANALDSGAPVSYILMDSWFTMDKVIAPIKKMGLDVIGMVKDFKANIFYENIGDDRYVTIKALIKKYAIKTRTDICGSCVVYTKSQIPVKIVFIKNRNDNKTILSILSTDISLSEKEIVTRYSYRWGCETQFHIKKQYLGFEKGCQARNFDHINAHCHMTSIRYMMMQYFERCDKDFRLGGQLFADLCEELRAHDFTQALNYIFTSLESAIGKIITCQVKSAKKRAKMISEIHSLFCELFGSLSNYVKTFLSYDIRLRYEYSTKANEGMLQAAT